MPKLESEVKQESAYSLADYQSPGIEYLTKFDEPVRLYQRIIYRVSGRVGRLKVRSSS